MILGMWPRIRRGTDGRQTGDRRETDGRQAGDRRETGRRQAGDRPVAHQLGLAAAVAHVEVFDERAVLPPKEDLRSTFRLQVLTEV